MTLAAGYRIGSFEVESLLGSGGMGEVYKARDTRLDRIVAIKVLPKHLAESPERKARFEREARAISQLNHPNICTLYDVGEQDGTDYLVMEYIEGETLADRLKKGRLKLDHALEVGIQIADGLDMAHRAGIVHRDLKPGNVMLTKSGVKILDFGLAKLVESEPTADDSDAPTEQRDLTEAHAVVGTPRFMAPEQKAGGRVDARTDIYAFGMVLRDMFGEKAERPPELERLQKKCLAEEPDDRWQTARDLTDELKWLSSSRPEPRRTRSSNVVTPWLAAAALGFFSLWLAIGTTEVPDPTSFRFSVLPPEGEFARPPASPVLSLSPDGRYLAFMAGEQSDFRLWVRALGDTSARTLARLGGFSFGPHAWSPDSRRLAYIKDGVIYAADARTLESERLCDVPQVLSATMNELGQVLVSSLRLETIRVACTDGPTAVTELDAARGEQGHRFPWFLPDGRHFLYLALTGEREDAAVFVGSMDDDTRVFVTAAESNAVYANGTLLHVRDSELIAQSFDAVSFELRGEPRVLASPVSHNRAGYYAGLSASLTGVLAFGEGRPPLSELVWLDRTGQDGQPLGEPSNYATPRVSPDGKTVAVTRADDNLNRDVWALDAAGRGELRLTFGAEDDQNPVWAADGSSVYFRSEATEGSAGSSGTGLSIFEVSSDGSGNPRWIGGDAGGVWLGDLASGESAILGTRGQQLLLLPLEEGAEPEIFPTAPARVTDPRLSPDERWLVYSSSESGQPEIYLERFPRGGEKRQVSRGGGMQPNWHPAGSEIFYLSFDGELASVPVRNKDLSELGEPTMLFPTGIVPSAVWASNEWDIAPDGERFIVNRQLNQYPAAITVVTNWPALLEQ